MQNSREVARMMARAVMSVMFLGSGISLIFWLFGNRDTALQVCLGFGAVGLVVLLIGGYFVARARTTEV